MARSVERRLEEDVVMHNPRYRRSGVFDRVDLTFEVEVGKSRGVHWACRGTGEWAHGFHCGTRL